MFSIFERLQKREPSLKTQLRSLDVSQIEIPEAVEPLTTEPSPLEAYIRDLQRVSLTATAVKDAPQAVYYGQLDMSGQWGTLKPLNRRSLEHPVGGYKASLVEWGVATPDVTTTLGHITEIVGRSVVGAKDPENLERIRSEILTSYQDSNSKNIQAQIDANWILKFYTHRGPYPKEWSVVPILQPVEKPEYIRDWQESFLTAVDMATNTEAMLAEFYKKAATNYTLDEVRVFSLLTLDAGGTQPILERLEAGGWVDLSTQDFDTQRALSPDWVVGDAGQMYYQTEADLLLKVDYRNLATNPEVRLSGVARPGLRDEIRQAFADQFRQTCSDQIKEMLQTVTDGTLDLSPERIAQKVLGSLDQNLEPRAYEQEINGLSRIVFEELLTEFSQSPESTPGHQIAQFLQAQQDLIHQTQQPIGRGNHLNLGWSPSEMTLVVNMDDLLPRD